MTRRSRNRSSPSARPACCCIRGVRKRLRLPLSIRRAFSCRFRSRWASTWAFEDDVAGLVMNQEFKVIAEETIVVPAGEFRAYHFHAEQPWPLRISIDRWFVPGTGFVKDVTTTRGPTGRLLSRAQTVLTKFSKGARTDGPDREGARWSAGDRFPRPMTPAFSCIGMAGICRRLRSSAWLGWWKTWATLAEPNFIVDQNETAVTNAGIWGAFHVVAPEGRLGAGEISARTCISMMCCRKRSWSRSPNSGHAACARVANPEYVTAPAARARDRKRSYPPAGLARSRSFYQTASECRDRSGSGHFLPRPARRN